MHWGHVGSPRDMRLYAKAEVSVSEEVHKGARKQDQLQKNWFEEFSWNAEYATLEKMPVMRQFIPGSPEKPEKIDS